MSAITSSLGIALGETYSPELNTKAAKSYAWKTVQQGKIHLDKVATSFGGIHGNISWFRHLPYQIVPLMKIAVAETPFRHYAIPGFVKAFKWTTDASDFTEFLGDARYAFNNGLKKDFQEKNVLSIIVCTCGAIANVTNTIELLRVWGEYDFKFLGTIGQSIAKISVYGSKPLALVGRVTVSSACSATLCATFFFLGIKSHLEVNKINAKIEKKAAQLGEASTEYKAYTAKKENQLIDAKNKRLMSATKFALYFPMLILGVTNPVALGALGVAAFVATYKEKTFSPAPAVAAA